MQDFNDKKIVLGVTGSIAAYKAAFLIRTLKTLGAEVQVVMTANATAFITPLTLQALSGKPVRMAAFDASAEQGMSHIELARWADYFIIAPASANILAKFAQGLADDLLTTLYLATKAPVWLCPAMNKNMWHHPATQRNCALLQAQDTFIIGPDTGLQACGDDGEGRLADIDTIIDALRMHGVAKLLLGKAVLITAGPTHEALDPIRFLANKSSGKMGFALAKAAVAAGAKVTLITGPITLTKPVGATTICVNSAQEMHQAVMAHLTQGSIFIGAAAVADYRFKQSHAQKIKKSAKDLSFELALNDDIITQVVQSNLAQFVVGFAAETNHLKQYAQQKLHNKKLDMVIANDVSHMRAFNQEDNQVIAFTKHTEQTWPLMHKVRLAKELINYIAHTIHSSN